MNAIKHNKSKRNALEKPSTMTSKLLDRFAIFVFIFSSLLYANTLFHEFTQDDAIVIYDNMYTTKGVSGLKGIFTKDTFFGFFKEEGKAKLVSGGRYRPFTPAMFAIEYQLVGKTPLLGHLINILLYGLLCTSIYWLLTLIIRPQKVSDDTSAVIKWLPIVAALIYAAHPIHTEAVANIKGRDEIVAMLGSVLALFWTIKYTDTNDKKYLIGAMVAFFIGLLSKENTITFLAIIPLTLYYFRDLSIKSALVRTLPVFGMAILFLMIRAVILGQDFGGTPMELMNNPYLKYVNETYIPFSFTEKFATITFTLGKYVALLFYPHPLTHDYYPRYIDMMQLSDPSVIASLVLYITLIAIAIRGLFKKDIVGYGVSFYLITLTIVSNIFFPIGTNMSERFVFMPSLGFVIVVAYFLVKYLNKVSVNLMYGCVGVILILYSLKTTTRNMVWKSDYSLFTTDVKTSKNSAKVLNAAGGAISTNYYNEKDLAIKSAKMKEAIGYLNRAVEIHPTYKNPYLLLGNAYYYIQDYPNSIAAYQKSLALDPNYEEAQKNLGIAYRDGGKYAGETENNLEKSKGYLLSAYKLYPDDPETLRLLGVVYGVMGDHATAIQYFEKVVGLEPKNAMAHFNLSSAYNNGGNPEKAKFHIQKAQELNPNILNEIGK